MTDNPTNTTETFRSDPEIMEIKFRDSLKKIAHDPKFNDVSLDEVFSYIVKTASEVLGCKRSSIWAYRSTNRSGKYIRCLAAYDAQDGYSAGGAILGEEAAGTYLEALSVDGLLVMDDVKSDPRCVELNKEYLPSNNISSMLDAPYEFNGELAGALCLEHVGAPRQWTVAEQHFCSNMASLLTIASERHQRRSTEFELREEQQRFRSLVEELAMGFVVIVDSEIVFANRSAADLLRVDNASILTGMKLTEVLPNSQAWEIEEWAQDVKNTKRDRNSSDYRLTLWDNTKITLEITASAQRWYGQDAIQVVFRDVTEAAYAQNRLKRSERLLSQAQKIARLGSWVWDLTTDETECSLELRNLLRLKQGNPLKTPIVALAHPEDAGRLKAAQVEAIRTRESYQITYRVSTDSGLLWLEETGVPEVDSNNEVIRIHGTSRDITRQKFAELEAQATEERFSALGNSFPGGFIYCDLSARYLFINETYAGWFDIDPADYLGKSIASLIGENAYHDFEHYIDLVTSGQSVTFERTPVFKKEGIEKLQYTMAPDIGVNGEMRGFFGLLTDITELRGVELALRQAQKMEAMGQLTGGIAHDFNNILAILMGNLELAKHTTSDPDSQEYISAALQGVERGVAITQKLLGFARSNTEGDQLTVVNGIIDSMGDMISQSVGARVSVSISQEKDLWPTQIDAGDFEDAIINLCINARDAMPDGGAIMIKTENKSVDEAAQRIHPSLTQGDYVLVSVSDSGIGMDGKTKERLFEPFYTTKPEGKGTGLGMSMVFGFVKRSRGEVLVYSAEGEGTTINMYLPRVSASSQEETGTTEVLAGEGLAKEYILIVDDEEMVANVAAGILSELGYETRVATNTEDALTLVSSDDQIDLIFSDVVMPDDRNGFEFAKAVNKIRPMKVLLTSGFSKFRGMEPVDEESRLLSENILSKPYNRQELASSVRRVLDATG
ncbi:MAG: PAS domain-containing protein [Pseudomonadales bacterium]|nr:PAS domain-containing protein [Pseudomonadales bacterium]MBO6594567.1 PAS domain-containing protein [Pseudomonadales bacterium]MBO6655498.1 PAS domain-containing protein [Pseudomonadales bacterium]MBO6821872.1 PAS domain-containing protein [Pseudomonadales bacterium]